MVLKDLGPALVTLYRPADAILVKLSSKICIMQPIPDVHIVISQDVANECDDDEFCSMPQVLHLEMETYSYSSTDSVLGTV